MQQFIDRNVQMDNPGGKITMFSSAYAVFPHGVWPFLSVRVPDYVRLLHTVQSDVMLCWNMLITHCHSGIQDVVCQSIFRRITDALLAHDCLEMCLAELNSLFGFDTPPDRNDFRLRSMQDYPLVLNNGFLFLVQKKADLISSFAFQLWGLYFFYTTAVQVYSN